jgi:hypothetical protein
MADYKITPPAHWTTSDTREIFTQVALELSRNDTYGSASFDRWSTHGPVLTVRGDLHDAHKANIEQMYECILTKAS